MQGPGSADATVLQLWLLDRRKRQETAVHLQNPSNRPAGNLVFTQLDALASADEGLGYLDDTLGDDISRVMSVEILRLISSCSSTTSRLVISASSMRIATTVAAFGLLVGASAQLGRKSEETVGEFNGYIIEYAKVRLHDVLSRSAH